MNSNVRKNALVIIRKINRQLRKLTAKAHSWQFRLEWSNKPLPEWFDHYLDLYWQWHKKRNPLWIERGCFNTLAIKPNGTLLELCCGDGFNSYYFYSIHAKSVVAVDFDKTAIEHAVKNNGAKNIQYQLCDIRMEMPAGPFDNITWDAAVEHFTKPEIENILENIKKRLTQDGILSGYTILEMNPGHGLPQHEIEFTSKEDLMRFFTPYFKNVKVFETIYQNRHNLYFFASDHILPFDSDWPHQVISRIASAALTQPM